MTGFYVSEYWLKYLAQCKDNPSSNKSSSLFLNNSTFFHNFNLVFLFVRNNEKKNIIFIFISKIIAFIMIVNPNYTTDFYPVK